MIKDEIQSLLNNYYLWLKDKTIVRQVGNEWVEITTPHMDRHNDYLQIYVRKEGNKFVITDDGYIISDLLDSGCSLDRPKRQELLNTTLAGLGVKLQDGKLIVDATPENFPMKKHNIIQAMLAVNDMFYLASPHIENLFFEDVIKWLDLSDIRYTPRVKFSGKIGYDHLFDFAIPKSRNYGERIVQTLSNPNKDYAESLVFKWQDTKENRAVDSTLFVLLNDTERQVSGTIIDAFNNYEIKPVLWSKRDQVKEELAA
ncbi:MAG: DUF1829 domain-containing protein [Tannerella sp.]|jgi:hypothetical protein|nr:DUF1829 domain-containing protein [Tannerella sp.]